MHKQRAHRQRPHKTVHIGIVVLLVMATLAGLYLWRRYNYFTNTPADKTDNKAISLLIHKGDSINDIAINLHKKNLILDQNSFKTYIRWGGYDRKIIAGRFLLNRTLTIPAIVNIISDSQQSEFILTVPEGSTIGDIDQKLVELAVIQPGDFIKATKNFKNHEQYPFLAKEKMATLPHQLEGYLFPDTYFIAPSSFDSNDLIHLMLNNFQKRLGEELNKEHDRSLFEIIIIASILEKEIRTTQDLPTVAGILWKRLDNNWHLGADATLLYLKTDRSINYKKLQEESPYNTRKNLGLPPGPIANPGLKSIMATLYPKASPYFFYLTKPGSGEVVYAVTNDGHNLNKQRYL